MASWRGSTALLSVVLVALATTACDFLLPSETESLDVVMGSSCRERLTSAVSVYVDNEYVGQTTGELRVEVARGRITFDAFTERRQRSWGPTELTIPAGGLRYTLDCN